MDRPPPPASTTNGLALVGLLHPYWTLLTIAFVAMLVEGTADLLDPWPLKVIIDYVIGSKPMPQWLVAWPAVSHNRLTLGSVNK